MGAFLTPVVMQGRHVRLQPLELAHVPALNAAAADGALWRLWFTSVPEPSAMQAYVESFICRAEQGEAQGFAVFDRNDRVIGHTSLYEANAQHRRVALGFTWYAVRAQRSGVNTDAKLLLLQHAFESMRCNRVELHTHWLNHRSRAAIERLGAKLEGVLRQHQIAADGSVRDSVMYSIIAPEWPAVKHHLQFQLDSHSS